ncbi:protein-disulfide reductase DsbD, partial [uncultured Bacteroides sp.]|uniref:protein-disulfide reductase DsbD family protein n=1 Tax=uncultured Bacteroides sp. TaxID=162156 RepID=UPI0026360263
DLWKPVVNELQALGETTSQEDMSWVYIFITGFIGGLLALFTPCVWPIIPMTVSFFLKRSKDKKKGIRDAWTYGASIVVIYVTLGLLVTGLFGANALNSLTTNAVFNIFFFLMLVVFAASFFGAFEITLPSKWSNAVDSKAEKTGGLLSIFLMAFTLSLVSFSCTGPIIGFLLVQVSTTGNMIAPAIGMLGFALALALPFTLFALFPSWLKSMPKSGGWMNVIKVTLGFLELAFALKFLSVADLAYGWRILDRETFLALWIVLFALLGLYLLGKIKFPHDDDDTKVSVPRFFIALCSLAFAVYMLPGLWGAPLKAVSAFAPPMQTQDFNLYNNEVHAKFDDYELGMEYARQHGKPVMLDFTGYGCVNCRKMELAVWTDPKISDIINNDYVLITLYVDNKTPLPSPVKIVENGTERTLRTVGDKWSYLQRVKFGANTQPFYMLINNEGEPLNKSYSYDESISKYIEFLQTGLENYKKGK